MDLLDLILIVLMALSGWAGWRRGLLLQLITYAGLAAGVVGGAIAAPAIAGLAHVPTARAAIAVMTLLAGAVIGNAIGWALGNKVRSHVRRAKILGRADALGGTLVSATALILVTWFLALTFVQGPWPSLARQIRRSAVVRAVSTVLPPPPAILADVTRFLNTLGFPDVFAGLPPAPAGPVSPPTSAQARKAFDSAKASTVQVLGQACGFLQEGSGFVAAPGYVVTNAHVVAGEASTRVRAAGGEFAATPVLVDPRIDIAILSVPGVPGSALPLSPGTASRGAVGAVLGYPNGGSLTAGRAAVGADITAVGRDIYGRGRVTRRVLELQALIRPGDSGGPFVLPNGQVAGVDFAASTIDPHVGYAIASTEVAPLLRRAVGRTAAAGTGPCTR